MSDYPFAATLVGWLLRRGGTVPLVGPRHYENSCCAVALPLRKKVGGTGARRYRTLETALQRLAKCDLAPPLVVKSIRLEQTQEEALALTARGGAMPDTPLAAPQGAA